MLSRNALILSTISLTALTASPAFAQAVAGSPADQTPQKTQEGEANPPTSTPTNAKGQPVSQGAIVITGSRIRRNNFTTPQNIDVYTRDDQILSGTRNTTETLQSATVTSGTSQISGSFLGFISDNGQGANVVGLRGLGATHTLVLLNGRRLAPAGVGPNLVAADLNVLPTAIVQRIEVLREGASSIYGSDAIAGVINVITDTSINGVTIDAYANHPTEGKGDTLRGSITAGKTFSRGHVLASFEYSYDKGLLLGDRNDWRCPRDLMFANGTEIGQKEPNDPNTLRCFPFAHAILGNPAGYGVGGSFNGAPGNRLTLPGYNTGNPNLFGLPVNVSNLDLRPLQKSVIYDTTVFSPIKTYSAYVNGAYDLDILGNAELYGEGLYTRRKSWQQAPDRPDFQRVSNRFTSAQLYGGYYAGRGTHGVPIPVSYFRSVTPFFPVAWANAGYNYFGAFIEPDVGNLFQDRQKVDFWRANGGMRGDLGVGDWRYDANIQLSRTKGEEDLHTSLGPNLANTLVAVPAPAGTPSQYIVTGLPGQTGAGINYTCASNLTGGAYNGGQCIPYNFFDPNILIYGRLPQALLDYVWHDVVFSKTKYAQDTYSLDFDGSLLNLQGGALKAAVGFQHRRDHIDDIPGTERQAGLLYNYGTAAETVGSDAVNEGYLDIDAPFLKDKPFANLLEVEASGRYTHYESYGSGFTYHINAQWAPVRELRFRGNYGTNFRAPNLYEQFVAAQVGFYPVTKDPCANFATTVAPGTTIYNNCLAALIPVIGSQAGALAFNPPGGSIQVTTQGGRDVVKAETAKTYGFGAVFTMPRRIADFSLAVDYWHVDIKGEVSTLGNLILNFCYQAADFPNNPYCALIGPRLTAAQVANPQNAGVISSFQNPYLNIAEQIASGIDFDARYATRFFGGRFSTQLQATRNLHQERADFQGQPLTEYNGTLGYPGFGSGPKWVGTLDTRFTTANNITFRWGVKYVGPQHSTPFPYNATTSGIACKAGTAGCFPVTFDFDAEPYWEHGVSVQWQWPTVGEFTIGVNNVLNAKPPVISDDAVSGYPRIGNYFANGPYEYRGRSVWVNVTRSFK